MWLVLILCFALAWALIRFVERTWHSTRTSWRAGKDAYVARKVAQKKLVHEAVDAGYAERTRRGAAATAAAVGATVTASRVHLRAAWVGLRDGWREGTRRAVNLRDHTVDHVPDETRRTPTDPDPVVSPGSVVGDPATAHPTWVDCPYPTGEPGSPQTCGKRYQATLNATGRYDPDNCGGHAPAAPKKEDTMPDATTAPAPAPAPAPAAAPQAPPATPTATSERSGEVTNMSQLMAELDSIQKEAAAEVDDAQNDAKRAADDLEDAQADLALARAQVAKYEVMAGCLALLRLDKESLAEINALLEAAQERAQLAAERIDEAESRLKMASRRVSVASARLDQATATETNVRTRHQGLQEAHQNAPVQAADREFYQE